MAKRSEGNFASSSQDAPGIPVRGRRALRDAFSQPTIFTRWFKSNKSNQRRFARIASLEILNLYISQRIAHPELLGVLLYEKVVAKYLNISDAECRDVVGRARQSYAVWPHERALKLNDVARYIIVNEFIEAHGSNEGIESDLRHTIRLLLPDNL